MTQNLRSKGSILSLPSVAHVRDSSSLSPHTQPCPSVLHPLTRHSLSFSVLGNFQKDSLITLNKMDILNTRTQPGRHDVRFVIAALQATTAGALHACG